MEYVKLNIISIGDKVYTDSQTSFQNMLVLHLKNMEWVL